MLTAIEGLPTSNLLLLLMLLLMLMLLLTLLLSLLLLLLLTLTLSLMLSLSPSLPPSLMMLRCCRPCRSTVILLMLCTCPCYHSCSCCHSCQCSCCRSCCRSCCLCFCNLALFCFCCRFGKQDSFSFFDGCCTMQETITLTTALTLRLNSQRKRFN